MRQSGARYGFQMIIDDRHDFPSRIKSCHRPSGRFNNSPINIEIQLANARSLPTAHFTQSTFDKSLPEPQLHSDGSNRFKLSVRSLVYHYVPFTFVEIVQEVYDLVPKSESDIRNFSKCFW